jgi:SAM-dependent methyltransferase
MKDATAHKFVDQSVDRESLENQVKDMYQRVAENPDGEFHFEMGRALCERLGYKSADLDKIPADAIKSFAGVGYYFHLADLKQGEAVIDLGSGSGTDTFIAALHVGPTGSVTGVDMTDAQRAKAASLRDAAGITNIEYVKSYVEELPAADASYDAVISNGVFNLSPDKGAVFSEITRVLKPGGRLAISDIVTERPLPEGVSCNADLWAACIGGAMQEDAYVQAIEASGLKVITVEPMPYEFISDNATGAQEKWGVKAVSLLAEKPI